MVVVAGLVGYAAVVAATGFLGDDDPAESDAGATIDDASPDTAADPVTDDAEGIVAPDGGGADGAAGAEEAATTTDSTTTTTEPEESDAPPSPENPAKVYIVGDSDAGTFGPYLQELLDGTLIADTELNYKVSSGLARPDFFNWPAELESTLPEVDPDVVVVTFGGNDSQGLSTPEKPTNFIIGDPVSNEAEWSEEYQRRAGEVMDLLLENDRKVIWVGIPNDDNDDVTARLAIQDRAVKAAAAERPGVVFVDTWARFSGRDGNWAEFVVDPRDGIGKDVRADDGFHLNVTGAEILAIDIAVEVRDALRDLGANI